jgi:hypothetical protein
MSRTKIDGGLRSIIQERMVGPHWTPIETGGTALGVPDLEGCLRGVQVWIECKDIDGWSAKAKMRPGQVAWIERRTRKGGRVFVAVRRAGEELWLFSGAAARPLIDGERLDRVIPAFLLGRFEGGPARWNWPKVAEILGF